MPGVKIMPAPWWVPVMQACLWAATGPRLSNRAHASSDGLIWPKAG
jgi:hypothetical protein